MTFEQIFSIFRRALPYALAGMAALGLAGLLYSLVTPREYRATARVIVDPRTRTLAAQDVVSGLPQRDETIVDTEVEFIESPSIAERVVRDKKLVSDPEFGASSVEGAVDNFSSALTVHRVGMTYHIDISVDSKSPERAAELANATAEAYLLIQKETKRQTVAQASGLLLKSAEAKEAEVREAEAAVARYRSEHGLLSVKGAPMAEQSAAELADQLALARSQERGAIGELAATASSPVAVDASHNQLSLSGLRGQQALAQQKMSAAASQYGERHPQYIAARSELAQINAAVAAEEGRARSVIVAARQQRITELRAQAASASNLRRSLEASAGTNAAGLERNSRASTELADLDRKAQAVRSAYQTYLDRYQQVSSQLGTEQSDSSLVSPAVKPLNAFKPNLLLNVAIGALAGLLIGISLVTIMMLFEAHFSTGAQIEEQLDLEALPALPTIQSADPAAATEKLTAVEIAQIMLANPTAVFAEMHRNLLVALDRPIEGAAHAANQIVMITSALPKEGKSTASICLAAMAAHMGKRTLLVDCDQRRRSVTREVLGSAELGVRDVLLDPTKVRQVVQKTAFPNLDILPASDVKGDEIDIFEEDRVKALFAELRRNYDLVLVDSAPVLPIADTRQIAPAADSVLFLCRWRRTPRKAVETALAILGKVSVPVAGVALTQIDLRKQAKFGYGDSLFYYQMYNDYYARSR